MGGTTGQSSNNLCWMHLSALALPMPLLFGPRRPLTFRRTRIGGDPVWKMRLNLPGRPPAAALPAHNGMVAETRPPFAVVASDNKRLGWPRRALFADSDSQIARRHPPGFTTRVRRPSLFVPRDKPGGAE